VLQQEYMDQFGAATELMQKVRHTRMDILWFLGAIALYFALQLWILPKLGIQT